MAHFDTSVQGSITYQEITDYMDWCLAKDNRKLVAGDFNRDYLTDLLCHNQNGEMFVLLNLRGNS